MRIAMITCYDEGEANSEYSRILYDELAELGHEVKVFRLPFNIFGGLSGSDVDAANSLIDSYCKELKKYDFVNIHYEFLLYGRVAKLVLFRLLKIIKNCKPGKFSIIFHNFPTKKIYSKWDFLYKRILKKLNEAIVAQQLFIQTYKKGGFAVVHTYKHKFFIESCCPQLKVVVHPLRYHRNDFIQTEIETFSRQNFIQQKGLKITDNTKIISVVGTLSPYKDMRTVIKSLIYLPDNYELYIWGGT